MEKSQTNSKSPWQFQATDLKMGHFTGLQVSHEPGQWGVWSGVVLMGVGLAFVFYVIHMRFWAAPVRDPESGKYSLWIGGSAEAVTGMRSSSVSTICWHRSEEELKTMPKASPSEQVAAGVSDWGK